MLQDSNELNRKTKDRFRLKTPDFLSYETPITPSSRSDNIREQFQEQQVPFKDKTNNDNNIITTNTSTKTAKRRKLTVEHTPVITRVTRSKAKPAKPH